MAAMGRRRVVRGKVVRPQGVAASNPLAAPPLLRGLNMVLRTTEFAPVLQRGVEIPIVGLPIMRDGFTTETGLLTLSPYA